MRFAEVDSFTCGSRVHRDVYLIIRLASVAVKDAPRSDNLELDVVEIELFVLHIVLIVHLLLSEFGVLSLDHVLLIGAVVHSRFVENCTVHLDRGPGANYRSRCEVELGSRGAFVDEGAAREEW